MKERKQFSIHSYHFLDQENFRNCPLFGKAPLPSPQKDNQSEDDASRDMGELSSVEGTKLTISKKLLKAQK